MTDSERINTQITDDPFASVRIAEYRYLMLGRFLFVMALRMTTTVVAPVSLDRHDVPRTSHNDDG